MKEESGLHSFIRKFFTEKDNKTPCDIRIYGFIFFVFLMGAISYYVYKEKADLQDIVNAFLTWMGAFVAGLVGKNKGEGPATGE